MQYYSLIKRNERSSHKETFRNLKSALLHEKSQSEKATFSIVPSGQYPGKGKSMETVQRSPGFQGSEGKRNRWKKKAILGQ